MKNEPTKNIMINVYKIICALYNIFYYYYI